MFHSFHFRVVLLLGVIAPLFCVVTARAEAPCAKISGETVKQLPSDPPVVTGSPAETNKAAAVESGSDASTAPARRD